MLRAALALMFFAAAAGAAWLLAPRLAALAEARYAAQVSATLTAGGHSWAAGDVDGLTATLSGAAPSDAAAAEAAALIAAISPMLTVRNAVTEAPDVAPAIIPPQLEILKSRDDLILSGALADPAMAAALDGDAALLRYGAAPFDAAWPATAAHLNRLAGALSHARITLSEGEIIVVGLAETDAARRALAPVIDQLSSLGWRVTTRIDAPPPVLAAFRLTVAKSPDGAEIACAAASTADAATIEAAARDQLGARTRCAIGAGAPDAAWPRAAAAVFAALAPADAAEAVLTGKALTLTFAPPTTAEAAARAQATLAATLPAGYRAIVDDSALAAPPVGAAAFSLSIDWPGGAAPVAIASTQSGGGLKRAEASLAAYARALFPGAATTFDARDGAPPPQDWRRAARVALEALSLLKRGQVRISGDTLTLSGAAARAADIRRAHDALAAAGPDWRIDTRIAYDPAPLAAAQPLPPGRCAAAVSEAVATAPISFQPASATLTPTGEATVQRIAAILTRCEGARFEIGGHTDAQGSEGGNLALSRARAEAVLTALIAAKAPPGRLVARGYGEARPIADNATAVGRALNRRIEFTLIEDPE